MIQRITSPDDFCRAVDDMYVSFLEKDKVNHHPNLTHDPSSIKNAFANHNLLQWKYPTWGSVSGGHYRSLLICEMGHDIKFNRKTLNEILWVSDDGKSGLSLFKEAEKFAIKNEVKLLTFGAIIRNPLFDKLAHFYTKKGFNKDSVAFTKTL